VADQTHKVKLTPAVLLGRLARRCKWQLDREGRSFSQDHLLDICLGLIELAVVENEYSGEGKREPSPSRPVLLERQILLHLVAKFDLI
jgi:hypothetical protein